ncbi:receptor-like protein 12 [Asparagus officinalis]|uniref:receptor-like protein 12 n=1 Tax=Asparagus officinalis TaxID=4686 RepID=UPI00098DE767|nr:receptor-like protein 12 [Asparagus officinalis]
MAMALFDRAPRSLLLTVIMLLLPFLRAAAAAAGCLPSERSSLLGLKHGVSFDAQRRRSPLVSWKPGSNCCDWEGVSCDSESGHVAGLNLTNAAIKGKLSGSLFNLTHLVSLDLHSNLLTDTIPASIGNLTRLKFLDLSNNSLSGSVPDSLFNLPALESLVLSENQLAGEFKEFSNLSTSLSYVDLSNNQLRGHIPRSVCEARGLEVLDLSGNSLSGPIPSCLLRSPALYVLNLRGNQLQGAVDPQHFNRGCMLEALILSDNHLEGPVSQNLKNCRSLEVLDVGNNRIVGTFPSWLGEMVNISVVILRRNSFRGPVEIGESLTSFSKLQIFDLSSNHFNGDLPSECFDSFISMVNSSAVDPLDSITSDGGYNYELTVKINGYAINFARMLAISYTFVDFSSNNFQGDIHEVIGKLHGLYSLNLSRNSLIGNIPSIIGNMGRLERLDLSGNHLWGEIPQELTSLTFLAFLNLSSNKLMGRIPQNNQFNTFTNRSYLDNEGLCGSPLSKQCGNLSPNTSSILPSETSDDSSSSTDIIVIALFFGVGFGVGVATILVLQNVKQRFWKKAKCCQYLASYETFVDV